MRVEVSPLVSYAGEALAGNFDHAELDLPFYLPARTETIANAEAQGIQVTESALAPRNYTGIEVVQKHLS